MHASIPYIPFLHTYIHTYIHKLKILMGLDGILDVVIHTYIHTIHTFHTYILYIHTHIHTYIHTYLTYLSYLHAYIHTYLTCLSYIHTYIPYIPYIHKCVTFSSEPVDLMFVSFFILQGFTSKSAKKKRK
jgi:hypothetical protein